MKTTIALLACALLAIQPAARAEESTKEKIKDAAHDAGTALKRAGRVIKGEARQAWAKTKEYVADEPEVYRTGARQKLIELRAEIDLLKEQASVVKIRPYFATQLLALEQQQQFATEQLAGLALDEIRKGQTGTRRGVDTTLARLEEHLDIAHKELRDLTSGR